MARLIITSTDSGSGAIKASKIADRVLYLGHNLTHSPAPAAISTQEFFRKRAELGSVEREDWEEGIDAGAATSIGTLIAEWEKYKAVELWVDPDTNAQLQLIQLLAALEGSQIVSRIAMFHAPMRIGAYEPSSLPRTPSLQPCRDEVIELARSCWSAFTSITPVNWFELMQRNDLGLLPNIENAILRMLCELPSTKNGLTKTQEAILKCIGREAACPGDVFAHLIQTGLAIGGYWPSGHILEGLAHCDYPAIAGLPNNRFNLELHDNAKMHRSYMATALKLTEFGEQLLRGEGDYATQNKLDYWWGGTRVSNSNMWRWSREESQLVGTGL